MIFWRMLLLVLVIGSACESKQETNAESSGATVNPPANEYPDITLTLSGGEKVSARGLQGRNIFIFFQPECDHCQEEAAEISGRTEEFRNYTLYFISSANMPQIDAFAADYGLAGKDNIRMAFTATDGVLTYFGPIPTPSIYIYADGRVIKSFNGITPVDNIIASLK